MLVAARTGAWANIGGGVPTAKDYVQDGLVAMWDGIENAGWGVHDPNATVWKDIVNGYVAKISNGAFSDDALVFNETTKDATALCEDCDEIVSALSSAIYTVEVVGVVRQFIERTGFWSTQVGYDHKPKIYAADNYIARWLIHNDRYRDITASSPVVGSKFVHSVACNQNVGKAYLNSMLKFSSSDWTGSQIAASYFKIGGKSQAGSGYNADFNCVRVYNRDLLSEEIAHNYAIDKARFNLP